MIVVFWSRLMILLVRALIGAAPRWLGSEPAAGLRIYFANHSSHLDTLALWSALPPELRLRTRPVAAADYWNHGRLRRFIAQRVLNAVLIDRQGGDRHSNPLQPLFDALDHGDSLIFFPEGTRRLQALPDTFKPGLYHLASRFPAAELIPVYLENLHRSLPKGSYFPLPLICTVRFGAALPRQSEENKNDFLRRARDAVVALA